MPVVGLVTRRTTSCRGLKSSIRRISRTRRREKLIIQLLEAESTERRTVMDVAEHKEQALNGTEDPHVALSLSLSRGGIALPDREPHPAAAGRSFSLLARFISNGS